MTGLKVGGLRTHEMRELKSNGLIVMLAGSRLQFQSQLIELDRQEFNRHVAVERLRIGPALDSIPISHLLVDTEKGIQLVVVNMPVLESASIHITLYAIKDLGPFALVLLNRDRLFLRQVTRGGIYRLLAINPREIRVGRPPETSLHCLPKPPKAATAPFVARLISWQRYHP